MTKTMTQIQFELSDVLDVHPENINVNSNGGGICVFVELQPGTDSKPILEKIFKYLKELEFGKRMVEVKTA